MMIADDPTAQIPDPRGGGPKDPGHSANILKRDHRPGTPLHHSVVKLVRSSQAGGFIPPAFLIHIDFLAGPKIYRSTMSLIFFTIFQSVSNVESLMCTTA